MAGHHMVNDGLLLPSKCGVAEDFLKDGLGLRRNDRHDEGKDATKRAKARTKSAIVRPSARDHGPIALESDGRPTQASLKKATEF